MDVDEFWPQVELSYPAGARATVLAAFSGVRSPQTGDRAEAQGDVSLDYRAARHLSYRGMYSLIVSQPREEGGDRGLESRLSLDVTYRAFPSFLGGGAGRTRLLDRTRFELRDLGGTGSYRVRNRLRLERDGRLGREVVVPYASVEAYYDGRYRAVSRTRWEVGASVQVSRDVSVEAYYGGQRDTRPASSRTDGIGVTLSVAVGP